MLQFRDTVKAVMKIPVRINGEKITDNLEDYQLLKNKSAP
jgi:hypothetical protein